MANEHILSREELNRMKEEVASFGKSVADYVDSLTTIINNFNADATVQSFYESGGFGEQQRADLEAIKTAITNYYETITGEGALIPVTNSFIDDQLARVK